MGLLQTPATSPPGHMGRLFPIAERSSWLSPVLKMSLKPLTNRELGAFGNYDRLTESQFINTPVWEWTVPSLSPVSMYGEGSRLMSGSQWMLPT